MRGMSQNISFMIRNIEGPVHLFFHHPVEFRFLTRDNGEVICHVPYFDLEVGGDTLEDVMNRTVRTIRVLANTFRTTPTDLLSEKEAEQKGLYLGVVDILRTFNLLETGFLQ